MPNPNTVSDQQQAATPHPRIVFMGTPEFAVASLEALVQAGHTIVGVVTAPDKPAGRGMQLQTSAVKKYALSQGLTILQPEKLKNSAFLDELRALKADLQVVVAFRMLPEQVWDMPPMGTINLHGSLLPQYRGAAPINWAVINGEKETGVTTFQLQHAIDTGNILLQESFPIGETDTAGDVHDRMKEIGARVLVRTVQGLAAGTLKAIPQDQLTTSTSATTSQDQQSSTSVSGGPAGSSSTPELKHAPKIFTETCRIDWNRPVTEIYNLIRGLAPFPATFTQLDGKLLKIYQAEKEAVQPSVPPGQFLTDRRSFFKFAAADGYIHLSEIQLEGKKRMKIGDFLRGYRGPDQ